MTIQSDNWAERRKSFDRALARGLGFWLFAAALLLQAGFTVVFATVKLDLGEWIVIFAEYSICIIMAVIAAYRMGHSKGLIIGTILLCLVGWIVGLGLPLILLFVSFQYRPPLVIWVCHALFFATYVLAWMSVISARRQRRQHPSR